MTYGRPTMTTHLAPLPPPDGSDTSRQEGTGDPSLMAFYTEAIKLYGILDTILSDVYYAWRGRSRQDQSEPSVRSLGGLDIVLEIERQLTLFETNLPSFLKWGSGTSTMHSDKGLNQAIDQQRNVLHARCASPQPYRHLGNSSLSTYTDTCISTSFYTVLSSPNCTQKGYGSASLQTSLTHKRDWPFEASRLGIPCTPLWLPSPRPPA